MVLAFLPHKNRLKDESKATSFLNSLKCEKITNRGEADA
jgi:hypothetical protein